MGKKKKAKVSSTKITTDFSSSASRKTSIVARILVIILAVALVLSMGFLGSLTLSSGLQLSSEPVPGVSDISNSGELPELSATSAYLIDADTGQVLMDYNGYTPLAPASTTKIMTAYLALKNLDVDSIVTVGANAASATGSTIDLAEGEQLAVSDLLYGLLLQSANDAAVALAEAVAGTSGDFALLMNQAAAEAGATGTHFMNPNGLPDEDHYTCAHDLACIAKMAMLDKTFREIVKTSEYVIPATNLSEERELTNSNRMLWDNKPRYEIDGQVSVPNYYAGTIGIKTGHTDEAGYCMVTAVEKNGHTLIGVTMHSDYDNQFLDMIKLMNYGFNTYKSVVVAAASDNSYEVKVRHSETRKLAATLQEDVRVSLFTEAQAPDVRTEVHLEKKYEAPIKKGDKLGTCDIYLNDVKFATVNVVAAQEAVFKKGPDFQTIITIVIIAAAALLIILIIVLIAMKISNSKKRKKRQLDRATRAQTLRGMNLREKNRRFSDTSSLNIKPSPGRSSYSRGSRSKGSDYSSAPYQENTSRSPRPPKPPGSGSIGSDYYDSFGERRDYEDYPYDSGYENYGDYGQNDSFRDRDYDSYRDYDNGRGYDDRGYGRDRDGYYGRGQDRYYDDRDYRGPDNYDDYDDRYYRDPYRDDR